MVALASIPTIAGAVTPVSGNNYTIQNVGYGHWVDDSESRPTDGSPIISWDPNNPVTDNMVFTYFSYPSDSGETIFTLQCVSTLKDQSDLAGHSGAYVRLDTTNNRLVQGGAPMAWKLVEAAPTIYKIIPFDDIMSGNGTLIATDVNATITVSANNQIALRTDETALTQLWTFNDPANTP
ncbi:hypothetical protein M0805_008573 [Coniferiporia weirii]|nr:hypothetical protein M0805_008573 [Coniferiporia weirii]